MPVLFFLLQILFESLPVSSSGHTTVCCGHVSTAHSFAAHLVAALVSSGYLYWYRTEVVAWLQKQTTYNLFRYGLILAGVTLGTGLIFVARAYARAHMSLSLGFASEQLLIVIGFFCTAGLLWSSLYARPDASKQPSWTDMVVLLFAQGLALLLPGCSRMATVYVAARWLGWSGISAWYWTLMTGLPLFFGAGLLGVGMLAYTGVLYFVWWQALVLVLVSWLSFELFLATGWLASQNRLYVYAWYLLAVGLVQLIFLRLG